MPTTTIVRCPSYPVVTVSGSSLTLRADGSRFFAAGFVYSGAVGSGAAALSRFDADAFGRMLAAAKAVGATTIRWNAFLKGLDLTFSDASGLVIGVKRLDNIKAALDLARHVTTEQLVGFVCQGGEPSARRRGHARACTL